MKANYREVLDNKVYIFTRDNAKRVIWHYYFSHGGSVYRGSTGHGDVGDATVDAISRYKAVRDGEVLVQTTRTSFKAVAERWLKLNETHRDIGNKRKAVVKFFIPYFQDELKLVDIAKIRQSQLNDYLVWRRNFYTTGAGSVKSKKGYQRGGKKVDAKPQAYGTPKNVTLNRENQNLNQIIAFARSEGFIDSRNPAKMEVLKNDGDVRPTFLMDQCATLIRTAKKRIAEGHSDKIRFQRQALYDFIVILRYTGFRPHEALNLRWGDIDIAGSRLTVRKGKTGSRIMPLPFPELIAHFKQMVARHTVDGVPPPSAGYLFTSQEGKPVASFKTSFEGLVKACGFEAAGSKAFSLYSFRHHLATYLSGRGVPDALVVQIMGTSRRMMDLHYDHTSADMVLKWFAGQPQGIPANAKPAVQDGGLNLQVGGGGPALVDGPDGLQIQHSK